VRKNKQPKWHKKEFADLRQQRDYYHGIKDTENFKKYRNKSTSSIRTSKGNYISEATKSGNNVGELWKHLKDINAVRKKHSSRVSLRNNKYLQNCFCLFVKASSLFLPNLKVLLSKVTEKT
jgi:hypothetical protein